MAGQQLHTEAFVLARRTGGSDSFEPLSLFSVAEGTLTALARVAKKPGKTPPLDLFDEAEFWLESTNQGRTWFIKEHRIINRPSGIGRSYDSLQCAARLTGLLLRNPIPDESREPLGALLRQTFAALGAHPRADIVWLKTLFCFLRDEGYPVKQQWWAQLPDDDREPVTRLLNQPLAAQAGDPATPDAAVVARLTKRLEDWLTAETELEF